MKLPNFRRIITGDYEEEYTELVDTLSVSINQGITSLYDALNKKVSLKYNILCTTKDITVQVDQAGNPIQPAGFRLEYPNRTSVVIVGKVDNTTSPSAYPTGVFVSWTQVGDFIQINNISGLRVGNSYKIRLVAFGDES